MDTLTLTLLSLTVFLSVGRNMFSKGISAFSFGTKSFFIAQGLLFLSGTAILFVFGDGIFTVSGLTVLYAVIYAMLLISAQWNYTAALKTGNTSVCATVYSLGFILPTLSGSLIWDEPFSIFKALGTIVIIPAIILSGKSPSENTSDKKSGYIFPLVLAMLSSGGLGIVQKIQQKSPYADEKAIFVLIAFALASLFSFIAIFFAKSKSDIKPTKKLAPAIGTGLCFGCCNLLNTTLAGRLSSAFFFPLQNISVILLSLLLSILIFREKPSRKDISVLILGFISIFFLNL